MILSNISMFVDLGQRKLCLLSWNQSPSQLVLPFGRWKILSYWFYKEFKHCQGSMSAPYICQGQANAQRSRNDGNIDLIFCARTLGEIYHLESSAQRAFAARHQGSFFHISEHNDKIFPWYWTCCCFSGKECKLALGSRLARWQQTMKKRHRRIYDYRILHFFNPTLIVCLQSFNFCGGQTGGHVPVYCYSPPLTFLSQWIRGGKHWISDLLRIQNPGTKRLAADYNQSCFRGFSSPPPPRDSSHHKETNVAIFGLKVPMEAEPVSDTTEYTIQDECITAWNTEWRIRNKYWLQIIWIMWIL